MTAGPGPTTTYTWFGPPDAPLFASLHVPADGRARGVVVLAPPIGLEMLLAQRTMRALARDLARSGLAALRFDYPGTGNSSGTAGGPDEVGRWTAGLTEAVGYARRSGAPFVAVVGLRMGATLAASFDGPLDALVLWDPCDSGARFLREEELLYRVGVSTHTSGERPAGVVLGPGSTYGAPTVAALRGLRADAVLVPAEGDGAARVRDGVGRVLLMTRDGSGLAPATRAVAAAPDVEAVALPGQVELFDWELLTVPAAAVAHVVGRLDDLAPAEPVTLDLALRAEAVVATTPQGRALTERVVEVGDAGLFGILARVEGVQDEVLVTTNAAPPAFHVGPARVWVEAGRAHAAARGPALRFDGTGVGESDGGPGERSYPSVYTAQVVDDIAQAVRAARTLTGVDAVALAGLCAGAWACLRAAAAEPVDVVHAINPMLWDVVPPSHATEAWPPARRDASVGPPPGAARRLRRRLRSRARLAARALLPEALWWRAARAGAIEAPAGLVTPLVRRGTVVHLVLGGREAARFAELRGGGLQRRSGPGFPLVVTAVDEVDHALMSPAAREAVVAVVTAGRSQLHPGRTVAHATIDRTVTATKEQVH